MSLTNTIESSDDYKIVSIRLRMGEFDSVSDMAKSLGITTNMTLRIAARRIGGFLEIDPAARMQLSDIFQSLATISADVGMLCSAYAEDPKCDLDKLALEREAFGQAFADLDAQLRSILNLSHRRMDGRQRLLSALSTIAPIA